MSGLVMALLSKMTVSKQALKQALKGIKIGICLLKLKRKNLTIVSIINTKINFRLLINCKRVKEIAYWMITRLF